MKQEKVPALKMLQIKEYHLKRKSNSKTQQHQKNLGETTIKKPLFFFQKEEKGNSEIEQLKNEIRILKQNKQYNSNSNYQPNSSTSHQKNLQSASIPGSQQQHSKNNEVMKVMNFIQQTMATLLFYSEKLKSQFDIDITQTEMS